MMTALQIAAIWLMISAGCLLMALAVKVSIEIRDGASFSASAGDDERDDDDDDDADWWKKNGRARS